MKVDRTGVAIIATIFAVVGVIAVYQLGRRAAMTAETTATVLSVSYEPAVHSSEPGESRSEETEITYTYSAAGTTAQGSTGLSGDLRHQYRPGQMVPICYDPEAPADSEMAATFDGRCGS